MYREDKELSAPAPARVGRFHEIAAAMRRGCALRPIQTFGTIGNNFDAACAYGAYMAAGGTGGDPRQAALLGEGRDCPIGGRANCGRISSVANLIVHLNDDHRWTREAIAGWLDSL